MEVSYNKRTKILHITSPTKKMLKFLRKLEKTGSAWQTGKKRLKKEAVG